MRVRVVWVVDGDTIHVRVGARLEKVRYIGVNAPEIPHPEARGWREGGIHAWEINRELVTRQRARLELDIRRRDSYGRLLAYVWVMRTRNLVMVNAELLRLGYAQVMTIPPNVKHQALFLRLQREARTARHGLWGGE